MFELQTVDRKCNDFDSFVQVQNIFEIEVFLRRINFLFLILIV